MKRILVPLFLVALALAGCSNSDPTAPPGVSATRTFPVAPVVTAVATTIDVEALSEEGAYLTRLRDATSDLPDMTYVFEVYDWPSTEAANLMYTAATEYYSSATAISSPPYPPDSLYDLGVQTAEALIACGDAAMATGDWLDFGTEADYQRGYDGWGECSRKFAAAKALIPEYN